jgi:hypothetical protein
MSRQAFCIVKPAASFAINANKIRITKVAACSRSIALPSTPKVTASKTAKNRRATRIESFSLERFESFLNGVRHDELYWRRWRMLRGSRSQPLY